MWSANVNAFATGIMRNILYKVQNLTWGQHERESLRPKCQEPLLRRCVSFPLLLVTTGFVISCTRVEMICSKLLTLTLFFF